MIVEAARAGTAARDGERAHEPCVRSSAGPRARLIAPCSVKWISVSRRPRGTRVGWRSWGRGRRPVTGNLKFDAPAPPRPQRTRELAGLHLRPQIWIAASTHDGEERGAAEAHQRLARLSRCADADRAAPSRARPSDLRELVGLGLRLRAAVSGASGRTAERRLYLRYDGRTRTLLSARRVVLLGKSLPGGADRTPSSRPSSPARSCTGRMSAISPTFMRARRGGGAVTIGDAASSRDAADRAFRRYRPTARHGARRRQRVERQAGAVERAIAALSRLSARSRRRAMKAPRFWGRPRPGPSRGR